MNSESGKAKEGPLMPHVYRADTVGSLLRPQYLKLAREDAQENKLRLVAEVANRVWPTGD